MRSTSVSRLRISFLCSVVLSALGGSVLSAAQEREVQSGGAFLRALDGQGESESGARQSSQGMLDPTVAELQITRSWGGNKTARAWLARHLSQGLSTIDPVWGGAYQILDDGKGQARGVEKSLLKQSDYVRTYSQAAFAFDNSRFQDVAERLAEFSLLNLRRERGAFYVSERVEVGNGLSASEYLLLRDIQRRDIAVPSVVKETPILSNARMVEALCALYASTLEERFLVVAQEVMAWLETQLVVPAKGVRLSDAQLLDQSYVASAALRVYAVTADRSRLNGVVERLSGLSTFTLGGKSVATKLTGRAQLARLLNLTYRYSGRSELLAASQKIALELRQHSSLGSEEDEAARVLLEQELMRAPTRITLVGAKESKRAQDLWRASLRCDVPYKRQEWLDAREGSLLNSDKQFPVLSQPAVFLCAEDRCSVALFTEAEVKEKIGELFPPL